MNTAKFFIKITIVKSKKMKDINLNNFIIENSLDIPLAVSIGVVSVPTGLNYSDQIKKSKGAKSTREHEIYIL